MLLSIGAAGCSEGPKLYSVSGIVTLDGSPVEGASVVFDPVAEDGLLAAGVTDAAGRYELRVRESQGAAAGRYRVTVLHTKTVGQRKDPESDDDLKVTYLLPKKFSDPETSGLEKEVPGNAYDLELSSR